MRAIYDTIYDNAGLKILLVYPQMAVDVNDLSV